MRPRSPAVCGFPAVWVVCEDVRCGVCLVVGECLTLVQGGCVFRAVGGGLRLGVALVNVRLDVVPLPPRSSTPTVACCRLGGFPEEASIQERIGELWLQKTDLEELVRMLYQTRPRECAASSGEDFMQGQVWTRAFGQV